MQDLFYSYEAYREYQDELAGDGFSNDLQRASFAARLNHPPRDERAHAAELVASGRFVLMGEHPYYCRVTDAILGTEFIIQADYDVRPDAEAHANWLGAYADDSHYYVLPFLPVAPTPAPAAQDDGIPF